MRMLFVIVISACFAKASVGAERIIAGSMQFEAGASIVQTGIPVALASGDFNGDGRVDLVLSGTNYISFLLGDGEMTHRAGPNVTSAFTPGFAVGDYNGDGKVDAVYTTYSLEAIEFTGFDTYKFAVIDTSFGRGLIAMGRFFTNRTTPTVFGTRFDNAAADFNGDGFLDYVTTSNSPANVTVALNDGGRALTNAASFDMGAGERSFAVAIGDWDGDGDLDIATANIDSGTIGVLLNDGKGAFVLQASVFAGIVSPISLVGRDMDGDGRDDLVIRGFNGSLSLIAGTSAGLRGAAIVLESGGPLPTSVFPVRTLTVNDFNNDGTPDVAWLKGSEIKFLLNVSPPMLRVQRVVDLAQIDWKTNFAWGFKLESSATLGAGATWNEVSFPTLTNADRKLIFDSAREPMRFFRLIQP